MTMNNPKKRRLGRGLEALLGPNPHAPRYEEETEEPRIIPMHATQTEPPASTVSSAPASYQPSPSAYPGPKPGEAFRSIATPSAASTARVDSWQADMSDSYDEATSNSSSAPSSDGSLVYLEIDGIEENPFQPRREFSESELASLSESLKEHDMLQPILVRRTEKGYQIISGERRWRAAQMAGWKKIPARIRQADDRLVAELAIVENLQRKDLNALEKAMSFKRYLDQHDCTQEDLAARLKIDRSTIANLIRLLDLPPLVQDLVRANTITAGHARALLPLGDVARQIEFATKAHRENWSVRETEKRVQIEISNEERPATQGRAASSKRTNLTPQVMSLEQQLRRSLGTKVEIRANSKGKGRIVIHFGSNDEFIRLRERLTDDGSSDDLRRVS